MLTLILGELLVCMYCYYYYSNIYKYDLFCVDIYIYIYIYIYMYIFMYIL